MRLNSLLTCVGVLARLAMPAGVTAQSSKPAQYVLADLGALTESPFSQATYLSNNGLISGFALAPDGTQRAVLWYKGSVADISSLGLGGPISGAFGVNDKGQADAQAESSDQDPSNENFCAYFTGLDCLPVLWQNRRDAALAAAGRKQWHGLDYQQPRPSRRRRGKRHA